MTRPARDHVRKTRSDLVAARYGGYHKIRCECERCDTCAKRRWRQEQMKR